MTENRRLGIVGGVGPRASAVLYLDVVRRVRIAGCDYPDVLLHSLPVAAGADASFICGSPPHELHAAVIDLLESGFRTLHDGGATCCALACNTLQGYAQRIADARGVRFLNLVSAALNEAVRRGIRCAAVLGSDSTRELGLYDAAAAVRGIQLVYPPARAQRELGETIIECLEVLDRARARARVDAVLDAFEPGWDGVLIACTDLSGLLGPSYRGAPVVDSLEVLAASCAAYLTGAPSAHDDGARAAAGARA